MASYTDYVLANPQLKAHVDKHGLGTSKSLEDWGKWHYTSHGHKESRNIPSGGLPGVSSSSSTSSSESVAAPKTASSYVDLSPDLASAWKLIEAFNQGKDVNALFAGQYEHPAGLTPAQQAEYWRKRGATSKEAFGQAHAAEDMALKLGTYKQSGTDYKIGSDPWKELFTTKKGQFGSSLNYPDTPQSTAEAPLTRWEMFDPQVESVDTTTTDTTTTDTTTDTTTTDWSDPTDIIYTGGGGDGGGDAIQTMDLATLTTDMDLSNKLTEVINMNSPLFRAASTKALQQMQKRGIVNSSLAHEAVMGAIMDVALPIAKAEVEALQQNLYFNTEWTNKQKQDANKYFTDRMLVKLDASLKMQLQKMSDSFQAWGRYGDWITDIVTAPSADQDAWRRMLDALNAGGGWPVRPV